MELIVATIVLASIGGMTLQQNLSLLRKKHRKRRLPLAIGSGLATAAATFFALLVLAVLRR